MRLARTYTPVAYAGAKSGYRVVRTEVWANGDERIRNDTARRGEICKLGREREYREACGFRASREQNKKQVERVMQTTLTSVLVSSVWSPLFQYACRFPRGSPRDQTSPLLPIATGPPRTRGPGTDSRTNWQSGSSSPARGGSHPGPSRLSWSSPARARIKRRSPQARQEVSLGQISVTLALIKIAAAAPARHKLAEYMCK